MYLLLFIVILIIIYVKSFKDDFTQEKISKVVPVLVFVTVVSLVLMVLASLIAK